MNAIYKQLENQTKKEKYIMVKAESVKPLKPSLPVVDVPIESIISPKKRQKPGRAPPKPIEASIPQ